MDIRKTVRVKPGHYVAAVSGGVDSVALLDIIRQLPGVRVTVAHYDHGIRPDSRADRLHVEQLARDYKLPFVYAEGNLGPETSEERARKERYAFLRHVQKQISADGIITAHHMDDSMETAVHNLLRGTGRKGMSSLKSVDGIMRPLLHLPKSHLIDYATAQGLQWREDSTNQNLNYRRNRIRHQVLPALKAASPEKYEQLKRLIRRQHDLNHAIDTDLHTILHIQPSVGTLRRKDVIYLPHAVARELVGEWLRLNGKRQFNRKQLELATLALKTGRAHTVFVIDRNTHIALDTHHARLVNA